jgi:[acyl-carrier-protein] S-malonyltransferase
MRDGMSYALVFPGQGMQHSAMLPWLAEDDTVRVTQQALGIDDWRGRLADPAWAGRNANAQVLLTGLALAAWGQIASLLPPPAAVAGYSVGELAAFAVAEVFDTEAAIEMARQRAALMDRSAESCPTGLWSVSGLSEPALKQLCAEFDLAIAIRNDIDSAVVGGPRDVLPLAAGEAQRRGAHCTPLNVHIASHTRWMADAASAFAEWIAPRPFQPPRTLLFSNAAGRVTTPPQLKQALAGQIDHTVRWDDCMESIAGRRVSCVLEIGPGQALARMWNRHHPQTPARSVDEFRSVQAIAAWIERCAAGTAR